MWWGYNRYGSSGTFQTCHGTYSYPNLGCHSGRGCCCCWFHRRRRNHRSRQCRRQVCIGVIFHFAFTREHIVRYDRRGGDPLVLNAHRVGRSLSRMHSWCKYRGQRRKKTKGLNFFSRCSMCCISTKASTYHHYRLCLGVIKTSGIKHSSGTARITITLTHIDLGHPSIRVENGGQQSRNRPLTLSLHKLPNQRQG